MSTTSKMKYFVCPVGVLILLFACSTVPILEVTYRLPPQPEKRIDKEVYLKIEDNRVGQDMIGEGARDDFKNFTGLLLLYLAEGEGEGTKLGVYDIKSMFYESFKHRLTRAGIKIVPVEKADQTGIVIKLNRLLLDLVDRKWVLVIDYELALMKEEQALFTQNLHGEAERLKILGLGQASKLMSELMTDIVNQMDLVEIFKKLEN